LQTTGATAAAPAFCPRPAKRHELHLRSTKTGDINCAKSARNLLLRDKKLPISTIREMFFNPKQKGAWMQAMYIGARLVRMGVAVFEDQYTISMPSVIRNALLSPK
jgi:hypothetical protein